MERLRAPAICAEIGDDPDKLITGVDDAHVELSLHPAHRAWTRYVGLAKASWLAVREPSDAMIVAADSLP